MGTQLEEFRNTLDKLDAEWLSILAERFKITRQIGIYKSTHKLPSVDPSREARQVERMNALADELGVSKELASGILRLIIDEVVKEHSTYKQS